MGKPKDAIWEKFGTCYRQGDARSMYCKCSSCNEPVIAAVGRMHDHYAGCKKRPWSIGQLEAGFQPSRKKMVPLTVSSSAPASSNQSKSVSPNDSEDDFFSGGRISWRRTNSRSSIHYLHVLFTARLCHLLHLSIRHGSCSLSHFVAAFNFLL